MVKISDILLLNPNGKNNLKVTQCLLICCLKSCHRHETDQIHFIELLGNGFRRTIPSNFEESSFIQKYTESSRLKCKLRKCIILKWSKYPEIRVCRQPDFNREKSVNRLHAKIAQIHWVQPNVGRVNLECDQMSLFLSDDGKMIRVLLANRHAVPLSFPMVHLIS